MDDAAPGTQAEPGPGPVSVGWRDRVRPFVKPVIILVVSVAVGWAIVQLVGAIDWGQVGASLARLSWWQALPLLAALLLRQTLNAVPLTRFVPGLSLGRSMQNDLTANLIGTLAPPPGDVVLRVAMFRSWGINPVDGMAGVTLNMLTFYVIRFLAPAVGLLLVVLQGAERGQVVAAVTSGLIAVGVLVALWLIMQGDRLAALLGRVAGRVIRRFRSSVDPEAWALALVDFRGRMAETLRSGLLPSLASMLGMVLADGLVLLLAVRFVGVDAQTLSVIDVLAAFLFAYPLTLMPLAGLGILDAALLAAWVEIAGLEFEPEIVAALMVWRITTIGGTLLLGAGTLLLWRRRYGGRFTPAAAQGLPQQR